MGAVKDYMIQLHDLAMSTGGLCEHENRIMQEAEPDINVAGGVFCEDCGQQLEED